MDQYTPREKIILKAIWRQAMLFFGYALMVFFALLYFAILYSYIFDTVQLYHCKYQSDLLTYLLLVFGLYLAFNIIFNYTLVIIVSPGLSSDLFHKPPNPNQLQGIPPFIYDPDRALFNKSMLLVRLDQRTLGYCMKCQLPKPQRSHHCTICNKCVLKMDHHCPWIGQCVGFQNHRYFILFLTYIVIGTLYASILNVNILLSSGFDFCYEYRTSFFSLVWPLNLSLAFMIAGFSGWNWYLILKGTTAIEFWDQNKRLLAEKSRRIDHLRNVFGDVRNWLQIFAPSVRDLVTNGVIWHQTNGDVESVKLNQEEETVREEEEEVIEL